jgi:hypothetical protein
VVRGPERASTPAGARRHPILNGHARIEHESCCRECAWGVTPIAMPEYEKARRMQSLVQDNSAHGVQDSQGVAAVGGGADELS